MRFFKRYVFYNAFCVKFVKNCPFNIPKVFLEKKRCETRDGFFFTLVIMCILKATSEGEVRVGPKSI